MKTKRGMQSEDILAAQWLSDVHLSPDGKQVAYVQCSASPEGGYESNIWLLSVKEPLSLRRITSVGQYNAAPRWSPDSKRIAFVSNRTGVNQIWLLNLNGGEALQMTHMRHGAFYPVWS
ncbi:MAG TPA: S9 family peptidase, partial [Bacillota bacterium]|nr:S9 family peptidase [Bacillota bacterium]